MNKYLQKALSELKALNAQNIPSSDEVLNAENNTMWSGTLKKGSWKLIKHHSESYTTNTQLN